MKIIRLNINLFVTVVGSIAVLQDFCLDAEERTESHEVLPEQDIRTRAEDGQGWEGKRASFGARLSL